MTQTQHPSHSSAFTAFVQRKKAEAAADPSRTFPALATVALADWELRDEAVQWCLRRKRTQGGLFRRKIDVALQTMTFEFDAADSDVVWFKLRYGSPDAGSGW